MNGVKITVSVIWFKYADLKFVKLQFLILDIKTKYFCDEMFILILLMDIIKINYLTTWNSLINNYPITITFKNIQL